MDINDEFINACKKGDNITVNKIRNLFGLPWHKRIFTTYYHKFKDKHKFNDYYGFNHLPLLEGIDIAIKYDHYTIVDILCTCKQINLQESLIYNSGCTAAKYGRTKILLYLIRTKHDYNILGIMRIICSHGHFELLKHILAMGLYNPKGSQMHRIYISDAYQNNHVNIVKILIESFSTYKYQYDFVEISLCSRCDSTKMYKMIMDILPDIPYAFELHDSCLMVCYKGNINRFKYIYNIIKSRNILWDMSINPNVILDFVNMHYKPIDSYHNITVMLILLGADVDYLADVNTVIRLPICSCMDLKHVMSNNLGCLSYTHPNYIIYNRLLLSYLYLSDLNSVHLISKYI